MSKLVKKHLFLAIIYIFIFYIGCKSPTATEPPAPPSYDLNVTYTGPGDEIFLVNVPEGVEFTFTIDLGSSIKDVYFIFTNTCFTDQSNPTVDISALEGYISPAVPAVTRSERETLSANDMWGWDIPEITKFNENPFAYVTKKGLSSSTVSAPEPLFDAVGGTHSFYYDSTSSLIPSTCRAVVTDSTKTLNIWVANDCWEPDGTKKKLINQTMVNALVGKFLQSGTNNDTYDWVTNIFGPEWGTHSYSNLIAANNEITILLYDIDNDDSTTGGVLGFFWAKDNFKTSSIDYSNQRIMFYLDAVLFATPEDTWDITDNWPSLLISTAAHEFQHMIHFYQKAIVRTGSANSETWINEMASMVTQDLVADKIESNGPRGVIYSDGSAGSPWITAGRLPRYNYYNDVSVTTWYSGDDIYKSYSINYAFGAYLSRNYGGVEFIRDVVHNNYTDYRAIDSALSSCGYNDTFASVLRKWAVANLLSDNTAAPAAYKYNSGTWFQSIIGINYNLGSINLYNYDFSGYTGPYIYTTSPVGYVSGHYKTSNLYYRVGSDLTGQVESKITIGQNVKLSVVVKDD